MTIETDKQGPVPVGAAVLRGIEAVRASGLTNMFDRPRVVFLLNEGGHHEAATWVDEHRAAYARGIFAGFVEAGAP